MHAHALSRRQEIDAIPAHLQQQEREDNKREGYIIIL
jgi:hypothetical protein